MHIAKVVTSLVSMENKEVKIYEGKLHGKATLSIESDDMIEKGKEKDARLHVEKILNLERLMPRSNLISPDGFFKPQLRNTVLGAIVAFFQTSCIREMIYMPLTTTTKNSKTY